MILFSKIDRLLCNANLNCSAFYLAKESQEYDACHFKINEIPVHYRKAKITPKKEGQFVTFWKRIPSGVIAPFDETDDFKFLLIAVETNAVGGWFIFPKEVLIEKKILTTLSKEGKRGFRIYPPWTIPKNKQAIASQKWQESYFFNNIQMKDFSW